jgi:hypothetical protein
MGFVGTVAMEAIVRQNRKNVAIESDAGCRHFVRNRQPRADQGGRYGQKPDEILPATDHGESRRKFVIDKPAVNGG